MYFSINNKYWININAQRLETSERLQIEMKWKGDDWWSMLDPPWWEAQKGSEKAPKRVQKKAQKGFVWRGEAPPAGSSTMPSHSLGLLADHRLSVVAGHIVEFHPIPERREHYYQVDFQIWKGGTCKEERSQNWNRSLSLYLLTKNLFAQLWVVCLAQYQGDVSLQVKTKWRCCQSFWGIVQPC